MTIASCGSVSALTLGLPNSSAVPAEKATLPKGLFVARIPVSAKTKQRLANDIETITMLSLLRPSNTRLAVGTRIPEVLAIGLRLHAKNAAIPTDIVELIAMQRKSGIVFVCVRDADFEGTKRQECAFAVRRALPGRAGHTPTVNLPDLTVGASHAFRRDDCFRHGYMTSYEVTPRFRGLLHAHVVLPVGRLALPGDI